MQKERDYRRFIQNGGIFFIHPDLCNHSVAGVNIKLFFPGTQSPVGKFVCTAVHQCHHSLHRSMDLTVRKIPACFFDRHKRLFAAMGKDLEFSQFFPVRESSLAFLLIFRIGFLVRGKSCGKLETHPGSIVTEDLFPFFHDLTILHMAFFHHGIKPGIGTVCRFRLQHKFRRNSMFHIHREQRHTKCRQQQQEQPCKGDPEKETAPNPQESFRCMKPERAGIICRQQCHHGRNMPRDRIFIFQYPEERILFRFRVLTVTQRDHQQMSPIFCKMMQTFLPFPGKSIQDFLRTVSGHFQGIIAEFQFPAQPC